MNHSLALATGAAKAETSSYSEEVIRISKQTQIAEWKVDEVLRENRCKKCRESTLASTAAALLFSLKYRIRNENGTYTHLIVPYHLANRLDIH